jgi:hypothetical protein
MKVTKPIFTIFLFFIIFEACNKDQINPSSNIILKDKDLIIIKANIAGKWKVCYSNGGFCGTYIYPSDGNEFIDFQNGDWIKWTKNTTTMTDTKISWKQEKDIFEEYTYVLDFGGGGLIVDRIFNDTLIIMDNTYDSMFYHLLRSN